MEGTMVAPEDREELQAVPEEGRTVQEEGLTVQEEGLTVPDELLTVPDQRQTVQDQRQTVQDQRRPSRGAAARALEAIARVLEWEQAPESSALFRSVERAVNSEFEAEEQRRRRKRIKGDRSSATPLGGPSLDGVCGAEGEAEEVAEGEAEGGPEGEAEAAVEGEEEAEDMSSEEAEDSDGESNLSFVTSDSSECDSEASWTGGETSSEEEAGARSQGVDVGGAGVDGGEPCAEPTRGPEADTASGGGGERVGRGS